MTYRMCVVEQLFVGRELKRSRNVLLPDFMAVEGTEISGTPGSTWKVREVLAGEYLSQEVERMCRDSNRFRQMSNGEAMR